MAGHLPRMRGTRSHSELIAENERLMSKIRGDLLLATDPAKVEKLKKNLDIKTRFVERLRAEKSS